MEATELKGPPMIPPGARIVSTYAPGGLATMWDVLSADHWLRVEYSDDLGRRRVAFMRFGRTTETEGRTVCTGLLLGGELSIEVTARDLRRIPVAALLSIARLDPAASAWWVGQNLASSDGVSVNVNRPGPKGHPRDHFEAVAIAYRQALGLPAPVKQLAKQFLTPEGRPTPEATVRRWLQRCRDMGLLRPARPGKAGESEGGGDGTAREAFQAGTQEGSEQ